MYGESVEYTLAGASNCALHKNARAYHRLIMHLCSGPQD